MAIYLTAQKKKDIFTEHGGSAANTGATESQVALMTHRINELSRHLQTNSKDNSCKRALLTMVGQRKRLLHYLMKKDIQRYREIIDKLGIRK
jgi:small subunit ribosomal protein S15